MELVSSPEFHFIPGYTEYCPQYLYRVGDTYGTISHKLLIDPYINRTEQLNASNRCTDDFYMQRPTLYELDLIKEQRKGDPVYKYPMTSGYEGFIPHLNNKIEDRFSNAADISVAENEKNMKRLMCEKKILRYKSCVQEKNIFNKSLAEKSLGPDYRLPLEKIRPECVSGSMYLKRKTDVPSHPPLPHSKYNSSYLLSNDDTESCIKSGFTGYIPFVKFSFGQNNKLSTFSALANFTNKYKYRKSAEWTPIKNAGIALV